MFAKTAVIACIIGLVRAGDIYNSAANLGQYGNPGAYGGQHGLARNIGYGVNPASAGGAVSYVNIVREITNHETPANGAYANGVRGLAGHNLAVGYNNAVGWSYSGGHGAYAGGQYPYNRNLGYSGAGYTHEGAGYPGSIATGQSAGNLLAGANGGVPTSYSNVHNGPLHNPLLSNGAYGIGASADYGGYGNGYGDDQAW